MLDPKKVKIGIAPIAWTEDDMPEMGAENSFLQTISEIALTGYVGTEIGCQFPRDPAILNKEFGRRGISAITGWISTYLNELPMWQNERAFVDHMNFLKSIGATIINTSDQSFSIQHQWNTPLSNKKVLNDDEWEVLTKGLDHLGKIAYDSGMKICVPSSHDDYRTEDRRNRPYARYDRPEVRQHDLRYRSSHLLR